MSTNPAQVLTANDWRQACRMAFGGFVGWALATLLSLPYAAYYAVYPLVLLGLSPVYDRHVALQFTASAPTGLIAASLMISVYSSHAVVMTSIYLGYVLFCFAVMTSPRKLFKYGAMCQAVCSCLVHCGSYPEMAWKQLFW